MTNSSAMDTTQRTAPEYRAHYESLRRHTLTRDSRPEARDGLAVLLRKGVAAWLQAWSRVPAPTVPTVPTVPAAPADRHRPILPDGVSAELIRVLAGMALGHLQEGQEVRP